MAISGGCNSANDPEAQIQGKWNGVRGEAGGEPTLLRGYTFAFDNGQSIVESPDSANEGTYEIDATQNPMHITFSNSALGIFKIENNELHLCIGSEDRPATFTTSETSDAILMICERAD